MERSILGTILRQRIRNEELYRRSEIKDTLPTISIERIQINSVATAQYKRNWTMHEKSETVNQVCIHGGVAVLFIYTYTRIGSIQLTLSSTAFIALMSKFWKLSWNDTVFEIP